MSIGLNTPLWLYSFGVCSGDTKRQRLRPTICVCSSIRVSWCSGVTVPAGPNQNDDERASCARSQNAGSEPMSASSGANSGRRSASLLAVM
jgi:hypothetical protein